MTAGLRNVRSSAACFDPANTRRTVRRLKVMDGRGTDSSYRFERGVDIESVARASARAARMIVEVAGGSIAPGVIDVPVPDRALAIVGPGPWSVTAREGALKIREASHVLAEGFDPERFTSEASAARPRFAYFPFGGGPHLCIGNTFALVETQLIVACVAQRYRLALVPGQRIEVAPLVTLRPKHGMLMTLSSQQAAGSRR